MEWQAVLRPGSLGSCRDRLFAGYDDQYGPGNWRLRWRIGDVSADFAGACLWYVDAYWPYLNLAPNVLDVLC